MIWMIILGVVVILIALFLIWGKKEDGKCKARMAEFERTHPQTPLTDAKKRLLTFCAIMSHYRDEDVLSLVPTQPLDDYADGLKDQWDVTTREEALETLGHLLSMETSKEIDAAWHENPDAEQILQIQKDIAKALKTDLAKVQETASTYAWDICRLASLAKWCYWLDYISEDEMWSFMEKGAAQAAAIGKDWGDYTVSFLLGRTVHGFEMYGMGLTCKVFYNADTSYTDGDVYLRYPFK